jgi:NADH:ubiquinone oxidoreductase subunit 2 (subunit N)
VIYLVLIILLSAAALCLGLSRLVPTRILGYLAAVASLLAGVLLIWKPPGIPVPAPLLWAALEGAAATWGTTLDATGHLLALVLLVGSFFLLLALALALAPNVRGFGNLFAWALLAIASALLGLASAALLVPFAWALAALLSYFAVRASGSLDRSEQMPRGIASGLLSSLLLTIGLVLAAPVWQGQEDAQLTNALVVALVALAGLMFAGGAPFRGTLDEIEEAPAALGGLLSGLVLPVLGLGVLLQFHETLWTTPTNGALPLLQRSIIAVLGILSLLTCAAGALREHGMRRLLGWLAGAQAGLVLLALALDGPLAALAAPALLLNLSLTMLAGALAAAALEWLTGSDDFTSLQPDVDLRLPGLLWAVSGLSVLGIPASWGFWARLWLFEAASQRIPWIVPPVLAASILLALAYLGPLARFWWRGNKQEPLFSLAALRASGNPFVLVLLLVLLLALALGLVPQLIWLAGLAQVPGAPAVLPVGELAQAVSIGAVLVLLLALLLLRRNLSRPVVKDEDMTPVVLAPDALAQRLSLLASAGYPTTALRRTWDGLQSAGIALQRGMALFEKRYYLAGVLLALISLIFLMSQG